MWKDLLKRSSAVGLVLLCVVIPIVGAGNPIWIAWTSPTTNDLNSVHMASIYDGWAVGDSGTMIHWNGADWSTSTPPINAAYKSVFMLSINDVWAVGVRTVIVRPGVWAANPVIGHWDGFSWSNVTYSGTGSTSGARSRTCLRRTPDRGERMPNCSRLP